MDPYQLLSSDEMTVLKLFYTRESDKGWTPERKKVVVKLLDKLRQHGLYIIGLYPSGSLRFAIKQKSAMELALELPDDQFKDFQAGKMRLVDGRLQVVAPQGGE